MKVLLYSEAMSIIKISGLGRAIQHQQQALKVKGIKFTTDKSEKDYDVIHINTSGPTSKSLAKKARSEGKAVVYHAHSTEEDFRNSFIGSNAVSGLFRKWIISCYLLGDVIVTPTEYSKQLLINHGIKKPIYAISNGIDLNFYKYSDTDRAEFRSVYGYSESDKVVMAVGLFFERKGILDFVELAKRMPDYKFIWFGETPLISVPDKIRKAVKTKLPNLVFAGYVQPSMLKKAYVGSDVYMFPTYEETEGIVLLEALASKAHVLIRDIPIFKWLKDGEDCYKAADIDEMEVKIQQMTDGTLPDISQNGYAKVKDKAIEKIGDRLVEAYTTALRISKQRNVIKNKHHKHHIPHTAVVRKDTHKKHK